MQEERIENPNLTPIKPNQQNSSINNVNGEYDMVIEGEEEEYDPNGSYDQDMNDPNEEIQDNEKNEDEIFDIKQGDIEFN